MSITMISVAPDVLNRLLALRLSEAECLDDVLRRALPSIGKPAERPVSRPETPTRDPNARGVRYYLDGASYVASDATEALIDIIKYFAQYDDNFLPKLAAKVRGRTRNHIARCRSEVYPGRPDLARYVKEFAPGWFIGSNIANREKEKILCAACEVMGVSFGGHIKIEWPCSGRAAVSRRNGASLDGKLADPARPRQ